MTSLCNTGPHSPSNTAACASKVQCCEEGPARFRISPFLVQPAQAVAVMGMRGGGMVECREDNLQPVFTMVQCP